MLAFVVDHGDPLGALEDCGLQLDFVVDVLSQGGSGGVDLGDMGAAGLTDLLRAVSRAINTVGGIMRQVYPAVLELIERELEPVRDEAPEDRSSIRRDLLRRLLAEETDASDTLAARDSATGGAPTPEPRLTEPRPRSHKAA
jgi:hypothetical protein